MKKMRLSGVVALTLAVAAVSGSCSDKNKSAFPADFAKKGDAHKVEYMMKQATPDSVARFICYGALGRVEGVKIDTLAIATLYAYEHYRDEEAAAFGSAYDEAVESLPLSDKMKLYKMAGTEDPQGLGYELGLEYMGKIRSQNMSVKEVERELKEFKKACASDTSTYRRFILGLRTVLEVDRGKDVPEAIYQRFINFE